MYGITVSKILFIIGMVCELKNCESYTYLPFGLSEGDTQTPDVDEFAQINLTESFKFYGNLYNKLYVNNDGIISFNSELKVTKVQGSFPLANDKAVICVLCADVDVANGGEVWYGMRSDPTTLNQVGDDVKTYFPNFNPSWVLVGTWNNVKSYANAASEGTGNVFQVILASDAVMSIVIFDYKNITWVYDSVPFPGISNFVRAKSGFNAGDGVSYYIHPDSKTEEMVKIDEESNYNEPGRFMYKVDTTIEQPTLAMTSTLEILTDPTTPITSTESISSSTVSASRTVSVDSNTFMTDTVSQSSLEVPSASTMSADPTSIKTNIDSVSKSSSSQRNTVSHYDLTTSSSSISSTTSTRNSGLPGYLTVIFASLGSACGLLIIAGVVYFSCFKKKHKSMPKPTKIRVMNNTFCGDSNGERIHKEPFKIPRPKVSNNKIHVI